MGGFGSGRQFKRYRRTTSSMYKLDIRNLNKSGLLTPWSVFDWTWSKDGKVVAQINVRASEDRILLTYPVGSGDDLRTQQLSVQIERTTCNLGGNRSWFKCPACNRRVAILYWGTRLFTCRHCNDLVYASQHESRIFRAISRADKVRERLGWEPGLANPMGNKPKGMHWRTFENLTAKYEQMASMSYGCISRMLGATR